MSTRKSLKLPPAVEDEIPEDDEAAARYYDTHDMSGLMQGADVEVVEAEPEPVGTLEIAARARVREITVRQWRARHADFPKPRWTVSGAPAWDWPEVRRWLRRPRRAGRPKARPRGGV